MDTANGQGLAHAHRSNREPDAILADLQRGLDALRSFLSEIDAREAQLGLDTLRSVVSQMSKMEQQET